MDQTDCVCCRVIEARLNLIDVKLNTILQLLISIQTGKAVDLNIVFGLPTPKTDNILAKGNHMGNKKATGSPTTLEILKGGKQAVMTPVTLTAVPSSITLVPVDSAAPPNPVPISPSDNVTGTLASDSPSFVVVPGVDSLHYTATIPANTPQGTVVNLSATLNGTIQGAPAAFTASIKLTLNIPPSPVAVDLDIILG